jgi:hypothetical protein
MSRKSASGSGIRDEQPRSYFLELRNHFFGVKILKFFDADPGSGLETVRIRDPGWKKVGSRIRDKHPGSATMLVSDEGRGAMLQCGNCARWYHLECEGKISKLGCGVAHRARRSS